MIKIIRDEELIKEMNQLDEKMKEKVNKSILLFRLNFCGVVVVGREYEIYIYI